MGNIRRCPDQRPLKWSPLHQAAHYPVHHTLGQSLRLGPVVAAISTYCTFLVSLSISHTVSLPPSHSLPCLPDFRFSFFLFILGLLYSFTVPAWHPRQLNLFLNHYITVLHKTLYPEPSTILHFVDHPL